MRGWEKLNSEGEHQPEKLSAPIMAASFTSHRSSRNLLYPVCDGRDVHVHRKKC